MLYKYCCNWSYVRHANEDGMWNEGWIIYAVADMRAVVGPSLHRTTLAGLFPADLPYGIITAPRTEIPLESSQYQIAGVCQECVQECIDHNTLKRWAELTKEV